MAMRGKTVEQKAVIKYFMSTGILGAIFKISGETFDAILRNKIQLHGSGIAERALGAHGMDADEVGEIAPIYVGNYNPASPLFKMFADHTFRASEYQMSYLMFSDKQMYAYSYVFDLTSANVTEQTKEYFYEDITSIDVINDKVELPDPRPLGFLVGGILTIIIGIVLIMASKGSMAVIIIGAVAVLIGLVLAIFLGFTRSVVDVYTLRLTVPSNQFDCGMQKEDIPGIQGMKAKIREKKL